MLFRICFVLFLILLLGGLGGCATTKKVAGGAQRIDGTQLRQTALKFAETIAQHFNANPSLKERGIFVAFLPTVNDTTDELPTKAFDAYLVEALLKKRIYTVRTEDRRRALEELEFNLTGLSDNAFSIGQMKTPNYFIKVRVSENVYLQGSRRLVEQTIGLELRSLETQLVVVSDRVEFKRAVKRAGALGW